MFTHSIEVYNFTKHSQTQKMFTTSVFTSLENKNVHKLQKVHNFRKRSQLPVFTSSKNVHKLKKFCGSVLHVTTSRHWQTISKQVITVLNHAGVCMSCMSTWHYLQRLTDEARYLTDCQAGSLDVGRWQHSYASSSWTPRLVKLYCIKYQFLNFHFLMQTTIPKCWMRCQDLQSAYNTYLTGRWIGFGVVQQYWTCSNYNTT